jgi:hypothetical protein
MNAGNLHSYVKTVTAIRPVSLATAAVGTYGIAVDASAGFDRAQFIIQVGAMTTTTGRFGCKVRHSDATAGTYTDYTSAALTLISSPSTGANKVYAIDVAVSGSKPFLKLYGTATKTVVVSAVCNLYRGSKRLPLTAWFKEIVVKP